MDAVFDAFKRAYNDGLGYDLSMTLSPVAPPDQPDRLRAFYRSTNFATAKKDFQYRIIWDKANGFIEADQGNGWVDLYVAYWKAVGEILKAEETTKKKAKVSLGSFCFHTYFPLFTVVLLCLQHCLIHLT
jgi:hypothetical protein